MSVLREESGLTKPFGPQAVTFFSRRQMTKSSIMSFQRLLPRLLRYGPNWIFWDCLHELKREIWSHLLPIAELLWTLWLSSTQRERGLVFWKYSPFSSQSTQMVPSWSAWLSLRLFPPSFSRSELSFVVGGWWCWLLSDWCLWIEFSVEFGEVFLEIVESIVGVGVGVEVEVWVWGRLIWREKRKLNG